MMARSRCSFSTLFPYGSLKVGSINAFPSCWNNDTGMIVAEELSFRAWKCFEHLTRKRVGPHLSWPNRVWSSSGSRRREEIRALYTSLSAWIKHGPMMAKTESRERSDV